MSALFLLLVSLNVGTSPAWGQQQTSQETEEVKYPYPPDLVNAYLEVCNQRSLEQGLNQQLAKAFCQCMINQLQNQYYLEAFVQLIEKAEEDQDALNKFADMGSNCKVILSQ